MVRPKTSAPPRAELENVLAQVVSISRLATYYGVACATMKRWLKEVGLESMLDSPEHKAALNMLVSSGPTLARRLLIDAEIETRLSDLGDRKLLARAIVDEFYAYYMFKKSARWERYSFTLVLMMHDFPPVLQLADLMGTPVRRRFRKTKT